MHENKIIPTVVAQVSKFTFNSLNFRRVAKQEKWCEAQLKLFANQFVSVVDKRIRVALKHFQYLQNQFLTSLENQ